VDYDGVRRFNLRQAAEMSEVGTAAMVKHIAAIAWQCLPRRIVPMALRARSASTLFKSVLAERALINLLS
jgi:hypothetical protein